MTEWQLALIGLAALGAFLGVCTSVFRLGKWVEAVNSDRGSVKEFMKEVREKLGTLEVKVDEIFGRLPPPTVTGASPLRLTDFGREISRNLNAKGWAAEKAPELQPEVADKEPYEIQAFCQGYVDETSHHDRVLQALIAKGAYEHGTEMQGVRDVFVIELRDALLTLSGHSPPGAAEDSI